MIQIPVMVKIRKLGHVTEHVTTENPKNGILEL